MTESCAHLDTARLSTISFSGRRPPWAIAVFAYNEAGRIEKALRAIVAASGGAPIEVCVIANGCSDATAAKVRACAALVPDLCLFEIDLADKANAWNAFVHQAFPEQRAEQIETFFFTDGDVTLEPDALPLLAEALAQAPGTLAAGGMPATGRDREAWRRRMTANGMLAGNLYALRGSFVRDLRQRQVCMPVGLIGEDFLVSWLVATRGGRDWPPTREVVCAFHPDAQFSFRSLSPWRLGDYRTYLRRKWRYTLRALQFQMLVNLLAERGFTALPRNVDEIYAEAPLPSRLQWVGFDTPLRTLAVLRIRSIRQRVSGRRPA